MNITLRDVNNHAPVFSRKHYVASIEENLPIGMYECSIKFHLVMSIVDQIFNLNAINYYSYNISFYRFMAWNEKFLLTL